MAAGSLETDVENPAKDFRLQTPGRKVERDSPFLPSPLSHPAPALPPSKFSPAGLITEIMRYTEEERDVYLHMSSLMVQSLPAAYKIKKKN